MEEILYEMFMDHRMKTFMGAFHINPDYTTWYGYAKMKQALAEIKELKAKVRRLEEDNEILRRASIFFAGELDPRNR